MNLHALVELGGGYLLEEGYRVLEPILLILVNLGQSLPITFTALHTEKPPRWYWRADKAPSHKIL
jgi:hypothetical protein